MDAQMWLSLGGLTLAVTVALGRVWMVLGAKVEELQSGQARLRLDVQREFASIGHLDKLEGKLDRLIDKVEQLGVTLAAQSRGPARSRGGTSSAR